MARLIAHSSLFCVNFFYSRGCELPGIEYRLLVITCFQLSYSGAEEMAMLGDGHK